jgi:hypothetical protein
MLWIRKKKKPQTEQELMDLTLREIAEEQARKKRFIRRFYRRALPEWLDRRIVFGILAVLAVIIFDGVRRENAEFAAVLTQTFGAVYWQENQDSAAQTCTVGTKCTDGGILSTGPNSYATLEFPDGTVITLAPDTRFQVQLLEYSRGGRWRARTFRLTSGRIWAKVSRYFGAGSDLRIYTPAAVAAVRGTQFSVYHDEQAQTTGIVCNDGTVSCAGWQGNPQTVVRGQAAKCAYGQPVTTPASGEPEDFVGFGIAALRSPDRPDSWIKKLELTVTYVLDLPLSVLGIGRCSWGVGSADFARRAAAMEALRLIHIHLETFTTYPDYVDPVTLKELGIPWRYMQRIQKALYGGCIERYYKWGNGFLLYARARDKRRTLYRLTTYGVEKGTKEDEAWAGLGF